jgi:hypothetical protein
MLLGGDADGPEASYFFEHSWDGENFVSISSIPPKQKIPWEHVRGIHRPFFNSSNEISIRKKKNSTCPSCPSNLSRIFPEIPSPKNPQKKRKKKNEKCPVRKGSQVLGPPGAVLSFCFISSVAFWATCKFASKLVLGVPSGL